MSTRQLSREIAGNDTQLLVQIYADRVFVLVTQLGKVGSLIQASIPDTAPLLPAPAPDSQRPNQQLFPPPSPAIHLTPLLGSSQSEHLHTLQSLFVSQIATIVWSQASIGALQATRCPIVVGLALKRSEENKEKELFQGVMSALLELLNQQ